MLTHSLELEENHLLKRVQYSDIPPHVEYSLTENGLKLLLAFMIIKDWGLEVIDKGTNKMN